MVCSDCMEKKKAHIKEEQKKNLVCKGLEPFSCKLKWKPRFLINVRSNLYGVSSELSLSF